MPLRKRSPGTRAYAGALIQRIHRRGGFLRRQRLPTAPWTGLVVPWILDLLRVCMSDQESARSDLSAGNFRSAVSIFSRGATAFRPSFSLELLVDLPPPRCALVFFHRAPLSGFSAAAHPG